MSVVFARDDCAVQMKDTPQWRIEWLKRYLNAEIIVTDHQGVPVRSEYRTLSGGKYPVAYLYPSDEGINI